MIRSININLNAAHPELPLVEATTFTGAPSSVFIRGVPKNCGNWSITAVNVAVTYPDNATTTRAAVESAEGVWVATIPGTATSGRTVAGFRILADGIDENGAAVTGYVLGFADFAVLSFFPVPAPGETFFYLRYFDTMPTAAKKMDVTTIDGVLKYYNGTAWLPFTDLTNYYTKTEVDTKIAGVQTFKKYLVQTLPDPDEADMNGLYLVPTGETSEEGDLCEEWTVVEDSGEKRWEKIGGTTVDLSDYYDKDAVDNLLDGKQDALTFDNAPTTGSNNPVKSGGIWAAIWGALSALPTGFTSLYDWCVAQLANVVHKTGDETVGGSKVFTGINNFYDFTVSHPQGQGYVRIYAWANENRVRIEFSDAVSGSQGELFLPVLGGYGAVTLAAIENLAPDAFLMLYDGATVDFNTLYCYQGRLYRCILGYTFQSGSGDSYPPNDMTHWAPATVEDVLAALRTAIAGKADVSAIPYDLGTPIVINTASSETVEGQTVYYGSETLEDRTANIIRVTAATPLDELRITFPSATSGKVRDFGLRVEIGTGSAALTAPALVPIAPTGETIKIENADGAIPALADGTATAKGVTLLYFSETAPGVFVVKGEQVEEVA